MQLAKRRAHQRVIDALISSNVQCRTDGSVITTSQGALQFRHDKMTLLSADSNRAIAVFRYKTMNVRQVLEVLQNSNAERTRAGRLTVMQSREKSKIGWLTAFIIIVLAAASGLALSTPSATIRANDALPASSEGGLDNNAVGSKVLHQRTTNSRPVTTVVDTNRVLQQMNHYEKMDERDRIINHTLVAGTWLQSNVESISRSSNHHIVWAASRDYRMVADSRVSGKGSEIARTLYNAVQSEFNGNLVIVHCANTTLITDAPELIDICIRTN